MQVELNYGRHTLPVELPDDVQISVVRKPPMPVLPDPSAAVRKALQEPVGTASLDQLARPPAAQPSRSATSRARCRTICFSAR
jgi:hypothetical protein